jgi:hypothetical protein
MEPLNSRSWQIIASQRCLTTSLGKTNKMILNRFEKLNLAVPDIIR